MDDSSSNRGALWALADRNINTLVEYRFARIHRARNGELFLAEMTQDVRAEAPPQVSPLGLTATQPRRTRPSRSRVCSMRATVPSIRGSS